MNALNTQVQEELRAAAAEASERADVRAVVLYGGPKVFAAGADIKEMVDVDYATMVGRAGPLSAAFDAVARIPKPVVAAVTGYALGGGCELALTADFRVCGDNAKLGQPEILLGIIPGAGGTQRLARLVGPARAKDIIFTGRFVDAEEALRIGLVDRVVAPDDVYSAAVELASRYVSGPAVALRAAKAAIDGGLDTDLASGLRLETSAVRRPVRHRGPGDRHALVHRERPRQGGVRRPLTGKRATRTGRANGGAPQRQRERTPAPAPARSRTRQEVEAARADPKRANVLYHDWEAGSYDEKWSISYDERCIAYARDRFTAIAGDRGWPYPRALEIGSGTGFFLLNLMQAGVAGRGSVTDISPGMVEVALRNARELGLAVDGRVADAETIPYEDGSFDLVVGHAVLHHIPDVELALREALRVLRPGGRFVFAGEPTRYGDVVARRLSRLTWWATTRLTRLPPLREWRRPQPGAGRVLAGRGAGGGRSTCTRSRRPGCAGWRSRPARWTSRSARRS